MLKHEGDARKVHERAEDFRVVTSGLRRTVVGWTFHVPRNPDEPLGSGGVSWVDVDGDVPTDTYSTRHQAADTMKAHLRQKRQAPVNELEKRA